MYGLFVRHLISLQYDISRRSTYKELRPPQCRHFDGREPVCRGSTCKSLAIHFTFRSSSKIRCSRFFLGGGVSAQNLTRGLDAVDERLHLIIAFGLICVEVGAGADHTASPVSELTVGRVLLLTLVGT